MTWLVSGKPVSSVLVTRLRYLGDVAMSTVVLEALLAGDPQLRLGYLCEQAHGEILLGHPHLDRVHLLGVQRSGQDAQQRSHERQGTGTTSVKAQGTWGMIQELRQARYDVAVDLFFNPRSAWLLWLSGIRVRIGGTQKSRRHLYTHTVLRDETHLDAPDLDQVAPGGLGEHLCRLAPLVHSETGQGFLQWLTEKYDPGELKTLLTARSAVEAVEPYLVLAPGATWPAKEWPFAHWQELTKALAASSSLRLKILVPPGRENQWGELGTGFASDRVEVLPAMGLGAVKDLIAGSRGLLSVDGGVMHMGVALGVPTLALFGPTDAGIWFPYEAMGPFRVLGEQPHCQPCHLHHCDDFICLPELKVERVLSVAREMFGSDRWPSAVNQDGGGA